MRVAGKLFGELESVHGVFVRLLAEFMSGQMISFAVGDGSGIVGVGRKVMEFCELLHMPTLWHGALLGLQVLNFKVLNHGRGSPCPEGNQDRSFHLG